MNQAGRELLESFETFARVEPADPDLTHAYWDDIGKVWTIGWGFTEGVKEGDTMTREQADVKLSAALLVQDARIAAACTLAPNENQLAAFGVCAWNIGLAGLLGSTMLKAHNRGDTLAASRAFALWNKAGGKVIPGLTRRRAAEAALYLQPMPDAAPHDMPQRVDPETPLSASPINRGAIVAGAGSTLGLVSEATHQVRDISDTIGAALPWVLGILTIAAVAYVVFWRYQQRKGGFA